MCVMITSALLCTETERWRKEQTSLVQRGLISGFLGRLGMTIRRLALRRIACPFGLKVANHLRNRVKLPFSVIRIATLKE
jgi:hypothetical protein